MSEFHREELYPGISFNSLSDDRFKTNKLSVHLVTPLREETASANALVPNLLRKGYSGMDDFTAFNRYLGELYGATVSFGVQKAGDNQVMTLSVLSIDDRYTLEGEPLTKLMSDILFNMLLHPVMEDSVFPEKEVELEKKTLIDAIEAEINNKRTYALSSAAKLMCAGEPYGISEFGTVSQAGALTAKSVTAAYHSLLGTARMEIMFVGSGDTSVCREAAKAQLKCLSRSGSDVVETVTAVHPAAADTIEHVQRMDVSQAKMVLGFSSNVRAGTDEMFALWMAVMIFGATPTSKLFMNVREKLSLCYYCAASYERSKGIVRVDSGVETKNLELAREEILRQLEEIKQGNFTQEEMRDGSMALTNSFKTVNDSPWALEGYYLSQILDGTNNSPERSAEIIAAVTREDIIAAARTLHLDIAYVLTGKDQGKGEN